MTSSNVILIGAKGGAERSVKNRFLDCALRAALRPGRANGGNDIE